MSQAAFEKRDDSAPPAYQLHVQNLAWPTSNASQHINPQFWNHSDSAILPHQDALTGVYQRQQGSQRNAFPTLDRDIQVRTVTHPSLLAWATSGSKKRTVTATNSSGVLFTIARDPWTLSGPEFTIRDASKNYRLVATMDTHLLSSKMDIQFIEPFRKVSVRKKIDSFTGLGRLKWKVEEAKAKKATLALEDKSGNTVAKANLQSKLKEGSIEICMNGLSGEQWEEIVIYCLAQIEQIKEKVKDDEFEKWFGIGDDLLDTIFGL